LIRNEFENKVRKFVDAQRSIAFGSVLDFLFTGVHNEREVP